MNGLALKLAPLDALAWPPDMAWLAGGERARLATFGGEDRRRAYLAGRWLLRLALAERLGGAPAAQRMDIDADGRTHCAAPGLFANLSHSGGWLACAVASASVGIDIEQAGRPRADLAGLAAIVHSPAQGAEMATLAEAARLRRFYQLWTLKEAALKRAGQGLDFARMRAMDFVPEDGGEALSLALPQAGLIGAVVSAALDAGPLALPAGALIEARLRLVDDQSTPKSK